jgi:hypothetical protein
MAGHGGRRAVAGAVIVGALLLAGTQTAGGAVGGVPRDQRVQTTTVDPRPTLWDGTRTLFPGHRLVAFYGAAGAPGLGVLGTGSPDEIWPRLRRQAKPYRDAPATVFPTYELIAYLATNSRGNQGNYSSRIPDSTIKRYVRAARRHHAMLILDIQPGRGSFIEDARTLRQYMRREWVGLALDPEWKLYGDQQPLEQIGHTTAAQVNRVSNWLNRWTVRHDLPQKPLLIHQFTADMVRHKEDVRERRHLGIVFNVDGFGSKGAKVSKYREFAQDDRFPMGFKIFYDYDDAPIMTPQEVFALRPRPVVVEYQ